MGFMTLNIFNVKTKYKVKLFYLQSEQKETSFQVSIF